MGAISKTLFGSALGFYVIYDMKFSWFSTFRRNLFKPVINNFEKGQYEDVPLTMWNGTVTSVSDIYNKN